MCKKKGFTLVELLAVIVILAIILAIAVPGISGIINSATKGAFESDAKMVLQQLEYEKLKDPNFSVTETTIDTIPNFNLSNDNYENLQIGIVDDEPYIIIIGKNKWDGLKACGTRRNVTIVPPDDTVTCEDISGAPTYTYFDASKGVNKPQLVTGMTPIKWDGSAWVDTTANDDAWYNYTNTDKQWANARTKDGSMWVWIPRYVYKIPTTSWHTSTVGTIDVQFSMGTDDTRDGTVTLDTGTTAEASNDKWTNHPAFTFGTTELPGIWVAKFEASGITSAVDFKPNVISLRNTTVSNMFTAARNMETNIRYGWDGSGVGIDTHLMKNTEWGATAYLSQSVYGKNAEIWSNPSDNYTTGCAGISAASTATVGCTYSYITDNGMQASTTGNIYGIYDMAGGAYECTSAYINNAHPYLTSYGSSIINADAKYKDIYILGGEDNSLNNYSSAIDKKGDAIYETSVGGELSTSWNSDMSDMPRSTTPWFTRGGRGGISGTSVGTFYFGSFGSGAASAIVGFRSVLLIEAKL